MALLTLPDIESWLGREVPSAKAAAATAKIEDAVAELEGWLGRTIETADFTDTVYVTDPDWTRPLLVDLPHSPVQTVTSVAVNGVVSPATSWTVERSGITLWSRSSDTGNRLAVEVVYTAGLAPDGVAACRKALKGYVGRMVSKMLDEAVGTTRATVEGYTVDYGPDTFTDAELAKVQRWKRRGVSSARTAVTPGGV